MPIPQVNDRIKEAPVVVLRAVFAGIGQILLTADKVRARATEQVWAPDRATAPGLEAALTSPARATITQSSQRPGNGTTHAGPAAAASSPGRAVQAGPRTATKRATPAAKAKTAPAAKAAKPAPAAKGTKAAPTGKTAPSPEATGRTVAVSAPRAKDAEAPTGQPGAAAGPPLPGYDDLSVASLRARLRVLDATTVEAMLAYEKAHARREPVITMLERRLVKLSAG